MLKPLIPVAVAILVVAGGFVWVSRTAPEETPEAKPDRKSAMNVLEDDTPSTLTPEELEAKRQKYERDRAEFRQKLEEADAVIALGAAGDLPRAVGLLKAVADHTPDPDLRYESMRRLTELRLQLDARLRAGNADPDLAKEIVDLFRASSSDYSEDALRAALARLPEAKVE